MSTNNLNKNETEYKATQHNEILLQTFARNQLFRTAMCVVMVKQNSKSTKCLLLIGRSYICFVNFTLLQSALIFMEFRLEP